LFASSEHQQKQPTQETAGKPGVEVHQQNPEQRPAEGKGVVLGSATVRV
jgi:hypothetical protein